MKNRMNIGIVIIAVSLALTACAAPQTPSPSAASEATVLTGPAATLQASTAAENPVKVSAKEAKERMGQPGVIVADVRTASEYEEKHIPGARLLTNETISAETAAKVLPDKTAEILVYCRSGRRSADAAQKLADLGYTHIVDFGGIIDWPYETEAGAYVE